MSHNELIKLANSLTHAHCELVRCVNFAGVEEIDRIGKISDDLWEFIIELDNRIINNIKNIKSP